MISEKVKNVADDMARKPALKEIKSAGESGKTAALAIQATRPEAQQILETPKLSPEKISYKNPTPKPAISQGADIELKDVLPKQDIINTKNLNISDKA